MDSADPFAVPDFVEALLELDVAPVGGIVEVMTTSLTWLRPDAQAASFVKIRSAKAPVHPP